MPPLEVEGALLTAWRMPRRENDYDRLPTSGMPGRPDPGPQYHFINNATSEGILKALADDYARRTGHPDLFGPGAERAEEDSCLRNELRA
jgi:hypothetical protein